MCNLTACIFNGYSKLAIVSFPTFCKILSRLAVQSSHLNGSICKKCLCLNTFIHCLHAAIEFIYTYSLHY